MILSNWKSINKSWLNTARKTNLSLRLHKLTQLKASSQGRLTILVKVVRMS
jgi:hypothetical protein